MAVDQNQEENQPQSGAEMPQLELEPEESEREESEPEAESLADPDLGVEYVPPASVGEAVEHLEQLDANRGGQTEQTNGHAPATAPVWAIDVDDKSLEFTVDEDMVDQLVSDAKADYSENLMEPMWAFVHMDATKRHHKRFIRVMGNMARAKSWLKSMGVVILLCIAMFAALLVNDEMGIIADIMFSLGFGVLLSVLSRVFLAYQETFVKTYCVERADFTDPGQVTAVVSVMLPRLCYYNRPDVWRGNDGNNGIRDKDANIVVQTGFDKVTWQPRDDWDMNEEIWCSVERTKTIPQFRTPADYYDLPADSYMVKGDSMKARRAWCRQLQRNGELYAKFEKGGMAWMDGKWGYLYAIGATIAGFFIFATALG